MAELLGQNATGSHGAQGGVGGKEDLLKIPLLRRGEARVALAVRAGQQAVPVLLRALVAAHRRRPHDAPRTRPLGQVHAEQHGGGVLRPGVGVDEIPNRGRAGHLPVGNGDAGGMAGPKSFARGRDALILRGVRECGVGGFMGDEHRADRPVSGGGRSRGDLPGGCEPRMHARSETAHPVVTVDHTPPVFSLSVADTATLRRFVDFLSIFDQHHLLVKKYSVPFFGWSPAARLRQP